MTAQTQKSLLSLGIFGALVFLAWKIWPTVKHAISGGGSSGTGSTAGGVGGGSGYPYPQQQQRGSGSSGGGGLKVPDGPNAPFSNNSFGKWLYNFTRGQTLASGGPLSDPLYGSAAGYDSTALDNYQFPSQTIDQFVLPSSSIDWGSSSSDINTSYDPSLDNFQFEAAGIDLGSGAGGGGFYGGIVDPGFGENFDNPDYIF